MKFEKIDAARKNPEKVTELDLYFYSTKMQYEGYNLDASDISDLIGGLSIFKNLEYLKLSVFQASNKFFSSILGNKKNIYDCPF